MSNHTIRLFFLIFGGLFLIAPTLSCTQSIPCTGEIGDLTLDPNGSLCKNKCDCNNQNYTGACISGVCTSIPRGSCATKGEQRPCTPLKNASKCKFGVQICGEGLEGLAWGDCKTQDPSKSEAGAQCGDGIDNDCDGKIDKADPDCATLCNPGQTQPCYEGPVDTETKGACRRGTQLCTDKGVWATCTGSVTPKEESCNGIDDNCDGSIDEGLSNCCQPIGRSEACYTGTSATRGVAPCKEGKRLCGEKGLWSECIGEVLPSSEMCNSQDDDCNGKVDDNLTQECTEGNAGCTRANDGTIKCLGTCKSGTQTCQNGSWSKCTQESLPSPEECNGKDDDCNGKIDDNPINIPFCENQKGVCKGSKKSAAFCQNGLWQPCSESTYTSHSAEYKKTDAICDNVDENCDGRLDEDAIDCVGTYAGEGTPKWKEGPALLAQFNSPRGLAIDDQGQLYVADTLNHRIRRIDSAGNVTTFTGNGVSGNQDGPHATAQLAQPHGLFFYNQQAFILDTANHNIRKATTASLSTYSGNGLSGSKNGPLAQAQFNQPQYAARDSKGNTYIVDNANHSIRKIDSAGNVTTFAGTGSAGFKDGVAAQAQFNSPRSIAIDSQDNLYIADSLNHRIRKIDNIGNITTLVGSLAGYLDGPAAQARLNEPHGLAFGPDGSLYIADTKNHRIRKFTSAGLLSTVAGNGNANFKDGTPNAAQFNHPRYLLFDPQGLLFIADTDNHRIRTIRLAASQACPKDGDTRPCFTGSTGCTKNGNTFNCQTPCKAGLQLCKNGTWSSCSNQTLPSPETCNGQDDDCNGKSDDHPGCQCWPPKSTQSCYTGAAGTKGVGLCVAGTQSCSPQGTWEKCLNESTPLPEECNGLDDDCDGKIDNNPTLAPTCENQKGRCKGSKKPASLCQNGKWLPCTDTEYKAHDSLYNTNDNTCNTIDDNCDGRVDETAKSCVTTVAGNGTRGYLDGPALSANLNEPYDLLFDPQGNLLFVERGNRRVRKMDTTGNITTIAGNGNSGRIDGPALQATLNSPEKITMDPKGNLYIVEPSSHTIRKLDTQGKITLFAGIYATGGALNGPGLQSTFNSPKGIASDQTGTLYVADYSNHLIRKITQAGIVSTYAGDGKCRVGPTSYLDCHKDGPAAQAQFRNPYALHINKKNEIYIFESYQVRKIDSTGNVSTIAGAGIRGDKDGPASQARFQNSYGITTDGKGNIYIADTGNQNIRKIDSAGNVTTIAGTQAQAHQDGPLLTAKFSSPHAITIAPDGSLYVADKNNQRIRRITLP